jgi:integrase
MHFAKWMEENHLEVSDLAGITHDAIAEYLACLRVDHCASTYNNRVCVLREIFHILAAKAGIDEDPWEGVKLRPDDSHSRRELTVDELKRLMSAAEKEGAEWKTLFTIGVYTGLRLGDCCRLEWRNVNMLSGIIQLIPRKTKRHSHGRPITIPLHPALKEILSEIPETEKGVFVLPEIADAYTAARWKISQGISQIFERANITTSVLLEGRHRKTPEATFHSLRHTFVSLAANAGVPLHIVQSIVGHESTAMTRHYYHENVDSLRMAVNAIPAL